MSAPLRDQSALDDEWDRVAAALNEWGIRYVAPHQAPHDPLPHEPAALLEALITANDVRLQEALLPTLLTHPAWAALAQRMIDALPDARRDKARRRYVAACALQREWRTRLTTDLGPQPLLPVAYLEELGLPNLDDDFGRTTLRVLAAQEEDRYGYNAWAGYTSLMDLFLNEITPRGWGHARAN